MDSVRIITYKPAYANHFRDINLEWIKAFFTVEPHDLELLYEPETHILKNGGEILFAQVNDQIAGTCALIKTGPGEFELAKMGVKPAFRQLKIGHVLLQAAIEKSIEFGCDRLWLGSNSKLTAALYLYGKFGFKEFKMLDSPFKRADIHMELYLNK